MERQEINSRRRRRRRQQRRDDDASAPKPTIAYSDVVPTEGEVTTPAVHDIIPDHVLELILLRLDSSVSLVRAASACKHWCRVVADAGFLSRFRLCVPLVMGHYHNSSNPPDFVPSPPTRPIPITQSALDFVPGVGTWVWETVDSRDGLLLLRNKNRLSSYDPDLVVCVPNMRRYKPVTMPDKLRRRSHTHLGRFLLKGGATGRHGGELSTSLSNFKLLVVLLRDHMVARGRGVPEAFVYLGSNCSWRAVNCAWKGSIDIPRVTALYHFAGRANGSLFWAIQGAGAVVLVLDEATTGVSLEALPVSIEGWHGARCFRAIGSEDGTLRAVGLVDHDLRVFARLKGGGGGDGWVLQNLVRLPETTAWFFPGSAMIVAAHETSVLVTPQRNRWLFSVDLKTMAVERVLERDKEMEPAYPYQLPWPPILSATARLVCTGVATFSMSSVM